MQPQYGMELGYETNSRNGAIGTAKKEEDWFEVIPKRVGELERLLLAIRSVNYQYRDSEDPTFAMAHWQKIENRILSSVKMIREIHNLSIEPFHPADEIKSRLVVLIENDHIINLRLKRLLACGVVDHPAEFLELWEETYAVVVKNLRLMSLFMRATSRPDFSYHHRN
ncbi:MAG: hypothetical protein P1U89_20680 [Verrucomicrobiales bacterium]|nr:hypothetical protein [Verrucomicrobiales bacterium]